MTYEEIADYYRNVMGVSRESSIQTLAENTRFRQRRKGEHLLKVGDDMTTVMFHLSGVARCYVLDDRGRECIFGFCHGIGACLGAAGIQEKVSFNIEAVTDMDTLELPIKVMAHLIKKDPEAFEIYQRLLIEDHNTDYRWHIAMQTKKGAERYRWFLEEYADIAEIVTQRDIASFLSLKPQSLSRIKTAMEENAEK